MEKYLSFHLSYFDLSKNAPGALLTRMPIHMINSILGVSIQYSCTFITELIIGCFYEYRLLLINFAFILIIVISNVIRSQLIETSDKKVLWKK